MPRVPDEDRKARPYAPRKSPEERREQLLDAALRVTVRDGIHKVSMDTVSKEAGVTRPVIYGVFTDTNDLLSAFLAREETAVIAQMSPILPTVGDEDPGAAVLIFLERFLMAVQEAPARWRAVFALVDSTAAAFRERVERGRRVLISVLEDLLRIEDPDEDTELYARAILALMWDAGRTVLAEPDQFPPERITTFARKLLQRLP
ncbi:TetR/AcrR family transcriptional regulator [Smaragdicoccus niigatensis]|uniref:TetR/AcrR family transcriptional regulator n=1 Tax=Smaragdicoccus niigatensis TaxID=359359 RepID=UPI0003805423|nr:TetR/AcrR family transcriptional regulator [Smaragdicoccus niigatensis]